MNPTLTDVLTALARLEACLPRLTAAQANALRTNGWEELQRLAWLLEMWQSNEHES